MTWQDLRNYERAPAELGSMLVNEILYEFDGPCIFTSTASNGGQLLAYLVEEVDDDAVLRYLVAATTAETILSLKAGTTTVRDALMVGWIWVCDLSFEWEVKHVYAPPHHMIPEDMLPAAGTLLWPELEPALRVRLIGDGVREGAIPAVVLGRVAEIAKSLKSVFEYAARNIYQVSGRPPEWIRALYDLSAQRLAYGSFEVSFQQIIAPQQLSLAEMPDAKSTAEIVEEGWRLLTRGLDWATSEDEELDADNDAERKAILDALKRLSPHATGPITLIEVSGSRVGGQSAVRRLDRQTSKRVRQNLASLTARVTLDVFAGRVRDLDLDKWEFILRDLPRGSGIAEVLCVIDDEQHFEVAREAHYQELPVTVAAKKTSGSRWQIIEIGFAEIDPRTKAT